MTSSDIQVAVAVIINQKNEVLISLRAESAHQGGLWEFPGGKLEANESVSDALKRELFEELNIKVRSSKPFMLINHAYSDKTVILNIHTVDAFDGIPKGAEGQKIQWKSIDQLSPMDFPAANRGIIQSLTFPDKYMITGEFTDQTDFLFKLEKSLEQGIKFVQFRCKKLEPADYLALADLANDLCKKFNAFLFLNTSPDIFHQTSTQGLHLNSLLLHSLSIRPIPIDKLLSVSCHTSDDIKQAKKLNADIILLSPVKETKSHPGVKGIGWKCFSELILRVDIPVYALGGMSALDVADAKISGAQGIAAISSLWVNQN